MKRIINLEHFILAPIIAIVFHLIYGTPFIINAILAIIIVFGIIVIEIYYTNMFEISRLEKRGVKYERN